MAKFKFNVPMTVEILGARDDADATDILGRIFEAIGNMADLDNMHTPELQYRIKFGAVVVP